MQVLASQDADAGRVVRGQLLGPRDEPLLYTKHMAKHRTGVPRELLRRARHVLLVREPAAVIHSFSEVRTAARATCCTACRSPCLAPACARRRGLPTARWPSVRRCWSPRLLRRATPRCWSSTASCGR